MGNENAKESILSAVIAMLGEGAQTQELTVRQIAKRAGVGVGLINYHFHTKENLIDIAVQQHVDKVIDMVPDILSKLTGTAKQKLKGLTKMTMSSFSHNPSVARISILRDLSSPHPSDNTERTFKAYEPLILEITGADKYWTSLIQSIFCSTFQCAFLRAEVNKQTTGFDFFDDKQRDRFVEDTIETVLHDII
jgi:AcrR family transcriptional regulator